MRQLFRRGGVEMIVFGDGGEIQSRPDSDEVLEESGRELREGRKENSGSGEARGADSLPSGAFSLAIFLP
jgi:hypothetical protein